MQRKNLYSAILKAGLLAGTLDICSAFIYYFIKTGDYKVYHVLQYVASGAFGKSAQAGGIKMVLAGLVFHYMIAMAFTILFFLIYPKLRLMAVNRILTGIIYGLLVWAVMNLVVVPHSQIGSRPFNLLNSFINAVILVIAIGIPLSVRADRYYKDEEGEQVKS